MASYEQKLICKGKVPTRSKKLQKLLGSKRGGGLTNELFEEF